MHIKKLSPLVANQIAAGEVVERPSSVVKELLENSIDANAKRIQVDVERGGARLIRITDDGNGIVKDELVLALARHATSKIEDSEDLKAIYTLGFRGEALASISSVSRLTISSKPKEQPQAWSAHAEGLDMKVQIQPTAIPDGTIVEVRDLFFNTPARQKFLRAERTEYVHIEDVIKRLALANPHLAITLKHNGKVTKRIPASQTKEQAKQRLGLILGSQFLKQAIEVECQLEHLNISGWVSPVDLHQNSILSQHLFVNSRVVKDRTLNHAIRQAYDGLLPEGRSPLYVLYLTLDAEKVDVNVHPTKHEVRFSDARMVHDFISKAVRDSLLGQERLLNESSSLPRSIASLDAESLANHDQDGTRSTHEYSAYLTEKLGDDIHEPQKVSEGYHSKVTSRANSNSDYYKHKVQTGHAIVVKDELLLLEQQSAVFIIDLKGFVGHLITDYLTKQWQEQETKQKLLLIPVRIGMPIEDFSEQHFTIFETLGFQIAQTGPKSLVLRKIPTCIEHIDYRQWLQDLIYKNIDKTLTVEDWQKLLLNSLADYWQPEKNTHWATYIQPHNWADSKHCRMLDSEQLKQLVFEQKPSYE